MMRCALAAITALWVVAATAADFSNVTDILQGARFLVRDDDLLILGIQQQPSGPGEQTIVQPYFTAQGGFASTGAPLVANQVDHSDLLPIYTPSIAMARMFDVGRDFGVVLAPSTFGQAPATPAFLAVTLTDSKFAPNATIARLFLDAGPGGYAPLNVLTADFNGDGFDDALAMYVDPRATTMAIVTAKDVKTPASGLVAGERFIAPDTLDIASAAVGDFDGDGRADIAAMDFADGSLRIYSVDPDTLAISQAAESARFLNSGVQSQLVAGRFRDTPNQELVILAWAAGSLLDATPVTFAAKSLVPTISELGVAIGNSPVDIPDDSSVRAVHAIAAPLSIAAPPQNFFSNIDLLVVAYSQGRVPFVAVLPFDADFSGVPTLTSFFDGPGLLLDLAAGNFDNVDSDGKRVTDLQLAVFSHQQGGSGQPDSCVASIYALDPTGLELTQTDEAKLEGPCGVAPFGSLGSWRLVAGDTQGRSLRLGAPEKVVVTGNIQPDVVLGLPPSHVDWINPITVLDASRYPGCDAPPAPCLLNMTVRPSLPPSNIHPFATQFDFTDMASTSSEKQSTTSWSLGGKVTTDLKATYGVPDVDSVSVEAKGSISAMHKQHVAQFDAQYSTHTESVSVQTGFADYIFYTAQRMNYYYYPVIAQTVCPQKTPNCSDSQKVPLYAVFSAPDMIFHGATDGTTQEWYQPVHEPGNVLSYPWSGDQDDPLALLSLQFPDLTLDTQTEVSPSWQGTNTDQSTYKKLWSQSTGQGVSSGSGTTIKDSASVTVSATASDLAGTTVSGSVKVAVNNSDSLRTLNTSTQTLSNSTGITVSKPAFDANVGGGPFLYDFAGVIFGLQNLPSETPPQPISLDVDVQTSGPIVTAFLADVTRENAAGWKRVYGVNADVALSHPDRWDWSQTTETVSFNSPRASVPTARSSIPRSPTATTSRFASTISACTTPM